MKGSSSYPDPPEPVFAPEVSWDQPETACPGPEGLLSLEARLQRSIQELVRYYRHSAVGRRCHGIIHNLNAPLQVLSFQLDLLEQRSEEERSCLMQSTTPEVNNWRVFLQQRLTRFQQMRRELEYLQAITSRLIYQGIHEDRQDRQYLDLKRLYQDELDLYGDDLFFKHQVKKEIRLSADLPPLYGHYIDISQSFRNVVDNALEAMVGVEDRRLTIETAFKSNQRLVQIRDSGAGVPGEIKPRLFQPFCTTKSTPQEPRAGLGLFMARRLLSPYGGQISLERQGGETWVRITIPLNARV